eukprot:gene3978-6434_t
MAVGIYEVVLSMFVLSTISIAIKATTRPKIELRYQQQATHLRGRGSIEDMLEKCPSLRQYQLPFWSFFDVGGTLSTIIAHIMRHLHLRSRPFQVKRHLLRLEDGATVAIDWVLAHTDQHVEYTNGVSVRNDSEQENISNHNASGSSRPVIIVMHGLCGSSESSYVRVFSERANEQGFDVAVLNARGCGRVPLTTCKPMHAARTSDFDRALKYVQTCRPQSRIFAIGFSLGAGILANYLGKYSSLAELDGAVCVSPSWNFHRKHWAFTFWERHLVNTLKEYAEHNKSTVSEMQLYDSLMRVRCVREFDALAVVKPGGFRDVDDYYTTASSIHTSRRITVPTLALSAADDAVCCVDGAPQKEEEFGVGLVVAITRSGGHLGFPQGILGLSPTGLAEDAALDWFNACMSETPRKSN